MTMRRFLLGLAAALLLQGTVFAVYYDDLLFLRRPPAAVANGSRDVFVGHAEHALTRRRLTVRHLDVIAGGAQAFGLNGLEVAALERRVVLSPSDRVAKLRLADALRRAGRLDDAEKIYLDILTTLPAAAPDTASSRP